MVAGLYQCQGSVVCIIATTWPPERSLQPILNGSEDHRWEMRAYRPRILRFGLFFNELLGHQAVPSRPKPTFETTDELANHADFVPRWNCGEAHHHLESVCADNSRNFTAQIICAVDLGLVGDRHTYRECRKRDVLYAFKLGCLRFTKAALTARKNTLAGMLSNSLRLFPRNGIVSISRAVASCLLRLCVNRYEATWASGLTDSKVFIFS